MLATAVRAQTALIVAAEGRSAPSGNAVIEIRSGTKVIVVSSKDGNALVTVDGWVDASRLAGKLDTFPASVDAKAQLRVRASASDNAPILAELRARVGVLTLGKSGTWMHVKRSAWIPAPALPKAAVALAKPPTSRPRVAPIPATKPTISAPAAAPPAANAPPEGAAPVPAGAMSVTRQTKFQVAPDGASLGALAQGAIVQPLSHDHGWVKVRVEGWVPERDVSPADSALASQLSAADLRADPEGNKGKTVQWEVEVLSLQTADPLRRDFARDEPYLLAKGPGSENALLYLAVPPSLLNQAKALAPLTRVLITARVRVGRSEPVGTPILDVKSISKR
jgi:hypothetical protein